MRASRSALARRAAVLSALALLLAGCVPSPGGQCAADADCGFGLACQDGLCRPRPPRLCTPGCAPGLHCEDGTCALDALPAIAWVAPADGAAAASGAVAIALSVYTPAPRFEVRVVAEPAQPSSGAAAVVIPLIDAGDGTFRALLDAGALEERDWTLRPVVKAAGRDFAGPLRGLRVDRTGPRVTLTLPLPAGAAFLRSDVIEVRARAEDPGVGLDEASPALVAEGVAPIAGTRLSRTDWSFQLPLSAPAFHAAEGPLLLGVRARDRLGNETVQSGSVPVTRLLWRRDVGAGLPIRSSPSLDANRVYVGTDAARVVALDRRTSVPLWAHALSGPVSASPARGERLLYAASESGQVLALDPDSGTPRWSCPSLPQGVGFLSSPAVLAVPGLGSGGAPLEAVVLQSTGTALLADGSTVRGGVWALQGSAGFPVAGGASACWLLAPVSGGRGSAAIGADGAVYLGGDDARAHKLRLLPDATGAFGFREEWSLPAEDDIGASPAIDGAAIAFADDSGHLLRVGDNGAQLAPRGETLGEKLLASPVIAFGAVLLQGRDGTLAAFGAALPLAGPSFAPVHLPGASGIAATPAVGADGTIYVSAGRSLRALGPGGQPLWELQLGGASTASSPAIGCDGTLYVGDASGALSAIATDSKGLAPGWPRFRHDARGTGNAATAGCE